MLVLSLIHISFRYACSHASGANRSSRQGSSYSNSNITGLFSIPSGVAPTLSLIHIYSGLYKIPTGEFHLNRCTALLHMFLMATYGEGKYVEAYHEMCIRDRVGSASLVTPSGI